MAEEPILKRRSVRRTILIVAAILLLPHLYFLSFGPACWLCAKGVIPSGPTGLVYWPIVYHGHHHGPGTKAINAYADFCGKPYMIEELRDAAARM